MKKFLALTLALILSLALAACGDRDDTPPPAQNPTNPSQQEQPSQPQQGQPTAGQTTPNQTARAQTMDLSVLVNGTQETVPATLYTGTGYSLYIPTEGWRQEQDLDDGISSVSCTCWVQAMVRWLAASVRRWRTFWGAIPCTFPVRW